MLFLQFVFKQKASERTIDVIRDEKEGKTEKERERGKKLCVYICVCATNKKPGVQKQQTFLEIVEPVFGVK